MTVELNDERSDREKAERKVEKLEIEIENLMERSSWEESQFAPTTTLALLKIDMETQTDDFKEEDVVEPVIEPVLMIEDTKKQPES